MLASADWAAKCEGNEMDQVTTRRVHDNQLQFVCCASSV